MSGGYAQLHPSVQHHIVNTLHWPRLRPLQDAAVTPVLAGDHCLLLAPTAGGKTEAAAFPILSKMAVQDWRPLSVLYLAPMRALLNDLLPRLESYGHFVGRRVDLWHGDTPQSRRSRIVSDPPDLLLTTPESLESMLISRRVNQNWLFPHLRAVIIDEVHAFAGADRGWHLLAVLERLTRLAGRDLQRIGLSATVGNPNELLGWLCGSSTLPRRLVNPPAEAVAEPEVTLDFVGSLQNAALVIDRLHRGEKRLVFVDSRRRAEELAVALRRRGTDTFISHSSLGTEERKRSEQAFAESHGCVIVATSTLELGIDIGDLDRVIQIDSPSTVAGFLQRIGRSGRRPGTSRNALFLTTTSDALLTAAALLRSWAQGQLEPAVPPPMPAHLIAQQMLALTLQEADSGLGRATWTEWLGSPPVLGADAMAHAEALAQHLLAQGWLHEDSGLLSAGPVAENKIGRRNFLELTSVFVAEPLVSIRHNRTEIGQVPDIAVVAAFANKIGPPAILLAGRPWRITDIDWKRRIARVEPSEQQATVNFSGPSRSLGYQICQSVAAVLAGVSLNPIELTRRASGALEQWRRELPTAQPGRTLLIHSRDGSRWYTFGGLRANMELAARVAPLRQQVCQRHNLYIGFGAPVSRSDIRTAICQPTPQAELTRLVTTVSGALKLQQAIPDRLVDEIQVARLRDPDALSRVLAAPMDESTSTPAA